MTDEVEDNVQKQTLNLGLCWATENEQFSVKENWQWIPTIDGEMEYVDINAIDMSMEPAFDPLRDIIFRLFTRSKSLYLYFSLLCNCLNKNILNKMKGNPGSDAGQIIRIFNNADLINSDFNFNHPTRFRIHGWSAGGNRTGGSFRYF